MQAISRNLFGCAAPVCNLCIEVNTADRVTRIFQLHQNNYFVLPSIMFRNQGYALNLEAILSTLDRPVMNVSQLGILISSNSIRNTQSEWHQLCNYGE